jgi:hypothetical protein
MMTCTKKSYLDLVISFLLFLLWPRQESNLDLELRKLLYYPLYYEAMIWLRKLALSDKNN